MDGRRGVGVVPHGYERRHGEYQSWRGIVGSISKQERMESDRKKERKEREKERKREESGRGRTRTRTRMSAVTATLFPF